MDANSEVNERNECHMIRSAKEHRLTHVELKSGFTTVEEIYGSSGFDVWVDKCKQCGQLFIYCFKEKYRPCGDDDYWSFWVPVEESEIETVRNASPLLRFMGEFVGRRGNICWSATEEIYWQQGFHLAGLVFMPF